MATGLFATTSPVNGAEESAGLFYGGGAGLLINQLIGGLAIAAFVLVAAGALFTVLKMAGMLRVSEEEEAKGLDISEHGSPGYAADLLTTASA